MMSTQTNVKTVRKWFDISQYEQEQAFLEEMHRQGWCFVNKTTFGKYTFIPCQPEEMVYQLDYNPKALKNNPDYLQMFWDLGWESCYINNGYVIFRKPKRLMESDEQIYSNNQKRMKEIKKRFFWTFLMLVICAVAELFILGRIIEYFLSTNPNMVNRDLYNTALVLGIITAVIIVFFIGFTIWFSIKYYRLSQKSDDDN